MLPTYNDKYYRVKYTTEYNNPCATTAENKSGVKNGTKDNQDRISNDICYQKLQYIFDEKLDILYFNISFSLVSFLSFLGLINQITAV